LNILCKAIKSGTSYVLCVPLIVAYLSHACDVIQQVTQKATLTMWQPLLPYNVPRSVLRLLEEQTQRQ